MWRIVKTSGAATFFLAFLFVALPVLTVPSAIDPDLNPRIIAISLFSTVAFFFFGRKQILLPESYKMIGILSCSVVVYSMISVFRAINFFEAVSEWLRVFLIYSFLLVSLIFIRKYKFEVQSIIRFCSLTILILSIFAIIQTLPVIEAILNHTKFNISSNLSSTFSNKNFFSEVLVLLVPVLFYGLLNDASKFKFLHLSALLLAVFYILLLASLACWVALVISTSIIGCIFMWNRTTELKKLKKNSVIAFAFMGLILFFIAFVVFKKVPVLNSLQLKVEMIKNYISDPGLLEKNIFSNNNSVFDRLLMIRNSLRMIADHPIFGVGMNNWKLLYPSYGVGGTEVINSGGMNFEHPHNDYLLIFSEQGIFGLLFYLLFFYFVFLAWKAKWKNASNGERAFLNVILFALISFLVLSLFSYPRSRIYTPVLLMFYISLLFKNNRENEKTFIINPLLIYSISAICLITVIITGIRLDSEIHAKKMIKAKYQNNFARMMRESDKINKNFFPLEYSSTSIDWYKGMALFYSGQIPAALVAYQQALLKTPFHLRTLNDLATAYEQSGLPDSAISLYKRALSISPNLNDSRFNLSATYFNLNKADSAYDVLNYISYPELGIGPQENYVKFMSVILAAKIYDSLKNSNDTLFVNKMNAFINDIPRTKKYIRAYKGKTIWPDVFTDIK